jgi:hypothetical protein
MLNYYGEGHRGFLMVGKNGERSWVQTEKF